MNWIDSIILGLIEECGSNDIYEVCDYLGIDIVKLEPNNAILLGNESVYNRNFFNREVIFIRNDFAVKYARFVISHEVCHAVVHTSIGSAAFNGDLINKGKLERQANYFAFKFNNIKFDEIQLYEMTMEQISSCLELPEKALKQLFNEI
ncbi:ImmA/IrrE family metallo-endopeptidase [Clostridium pasteurianum]|uniref:Putative Zn peptidase n=1 Tax=Clostridium pasteurianum BC1 TaxID=86416 RepID=R4K8G7_CLOPA|nr:ImmA/IrrE family metallo-endopeptidase [Clostridium pasteurianum]AGK97981.1 putative Zn peptidase [Clostridium pasteurianum BC1]